MSNKAAYSPLVKSSALLHFKDCDVSVNRITYQDHADTFWDEVRIPPAPSSSVFGNSNTEVLSLQKLKDFNFQTDTKVSNLRITITTVHLITGVSMFACIMSVIIILFIITKKRTNKIVPPALKSTLRAQQHRLVILYLCY